MSNPPFIVTSYLHMRISSIDDLPEGPHLVRTPDGKGFRPFYPPNIPKEKLLAAIAEGRVYVLWSSDQRPLEQVSSDWPTTTQPARPEVFVDVG